MIRDLDCPHSRFMARYSDRYCYLDSGGGSTTNTSTSQPSSFAQPYLTDLMTQAKSLYNQGTSYAPFSTVAPFSPQTTQALDATQQRALNGSPVTNAADSSITNLLQSPNSGPGNSTLQNFSDPNNINPYLNSEYAATSKPVIDSVNAQFSQAGRTGSTANQDALTTQLGNLSSNIYGTGYENAANRSVTAANALNSNNLALGNQKVAAGALAPSLANQDYTNLQSLLGVGQSYDTQAQNYINDATNRYNYSQNQPWNLLSMYAGNVNGTNLGQSTSTSSQAPTQSTLPLFGAAGVNLLGSPTSSGSSLFSNLLGY